MLRGKCLRHLQNLPISNIPASTQTGSGGSKRDLFTESTTYSHAPVLAHLLARQFFDKELFFRFCRFVQCYLGNLFPGLCFHSESIVSESQGNEGLEFCVWREPVSTQWATANIIVAVIYGSLTCISSDVLEGSWAVDSVSSYHRHPAWLHEWLQ